MKTTKLISCVLAAGMLFASCNWSNTGKGALIGGGSGAALGAGIGAIFGKGKGAAIGAAVGAAVGTTAGALIGKKMDKAAEKAKQVEGADVSQITDANGLQAVKVTFDSGILFATSGSALSSSAKSSLNKFANEVLKQNTDMDVAIYGFTDNTGWKNSTAEQSKQKNIDLSQKRAQSVATYLSDCGVAAKQLKTIEGLGEADPVADNATAAGRQENRRVEVYLYASQEMIEAAEAEAAK